MNRSIKSLLCPTKQQIVTTVATVALTGMLGMPTLVEAKAKAAEKPVAVKVTKASKTKTKSAKTDTKNKHKSKHQTTVTEQSTKKTQNTKSSKRSVKENKKSTKELSHSDRKSLKTSHKTTESAKSLTSKHRNQSNTHAERTSQSATKQLASKATQSTDKHAKASRQKPDIKHSSKAPSVAVVNHASKVGSKSVKGAVPTSYQRVEPATAAQTQQKSAKVLQVGTASYYADKFDGKRTASGERFDQDKLTCAHGSLPFGCKIRVTNLRNNRSVDVKVNDRGGFSRYGRVVDLSKAAAREIGLGGTGKVKVELVD